VGFDTIPLLESCTVTAGNQIRWNLVKFNIKTRCRVAVTLVTISAAVLLDNKRRDKKERR
jgi:hypothetical protein